jgi:hypothetical protein
MKNFRFMLVASLLIMALCTVKAASADTEYVTIAESKPYVATNNQVQKFEEYISLKQGYDKVPLYLTYYNGSKTAPAFRWVRISSPSSNMPYVTEANFKNGQVTLNITGDVTWGSNQVMVTGDGQQGATLTWKLVTPKATVNSIAGENGGSVQGGHVITISGTNLPAVPSVYKVLFNDAPATVVTATSTQLQVQVPEDLKGGLYNVTVYEVDRQIGALATNVIATPKLTSISPAFAAPATQVVITGQNFSPNAQDNQVMIGSFQAQVVSASPTSLTVVVPINFANQFPQPYLDVSVTVNGVRAVGRLTISVNEIG